MTRGTFVLLQNTYIYRKVRHPYNQKKVAREEQRPPNEHVTREAPGSSNPVSQRELVASSFFLLN